MKKCQQICKQLRKQELTPEQERQLSSMEIESLSQLDAINIQHDLRISGVRGQLMLLVTKQQQHPATSVSAKAHLAIFAAHAMDVIIAPTREELGALVNVYETHINGIMLGQNEPLVVAALLQKIVQSHQFDEAIAMHRHLTNRMLSDGVFDLEKLDWSQKEQIVFGDLGLPTLVSRLDGISETAMQDADLFYQRLERFPDARKQILVVALAVIDKYLIIGQYEHAAGLLAVLQRIQPQTPDDELRAWFDESLSEYPEKIRMAQLAN